MTYDKEIKIKSVVWKFERIEGRWRVSGVWDGVTKL
jgi:hypothetical protein